jgi:hypothetical protein
VPTYVVDILIMREMHWTVQDYFATPRSWVNKVKKVLEAEAVANKAQRKL